MAFITWSDKFSVGIGKFDDHHQDMAAAINELHAALSQRAERQVVGEVLNKLAESSERHFLQEESTMEKYAVPGLAAHKREHENLLAQIRRFAKGISAGNVSVSMAILTFLRSWLLDHIQQSDKRYTSYLADKPI